VTEIKVQLLCEMTRAFVCHLTQQYSLVEELTHVPMFEGLNQASGRYIFQICETLLCIVVLNDPRKHESFHTTAGSCSDNSFQIYLDRLWVRFLRYCA
jgi:hypothetical protein